jgi:outer membrane protein OmpA-like peptidoglycan-associated protein
MIPYSKLVVNGTALAACIVLSACVSAPTDNSLYEARAAVQSAEANPAVARFDALDLAAAQKHLALAEDAAQHGASNLEHHEAYLATRVARLSEVRADEGVAQERVAAAGGDRARVELAARTVDAQRARDTATVALAEADLANQQSAAAAETVRELQAQIAGLNTQATPQGVMLVLTDDYFEAGRAELKPGAGRILDGLAQFLIMHPERRVRVEGHMDSADSPASNLALSLHRAEAVRMALIARGIDPVRSEAVGYGAQNPLASGDDVGNRHFIRGVEILLSDSRGQIASR